MWVLINNSLCLELVEWAQILLQSSPLDPACLQLSARNYFVEPKSFLVGL